MLLSGLRKLLGRTAKSSAARPRLARRRVALERLEDRLAPALASWVCDNGNWSNTSCWSTGQLPGTGDDVVINRPGAVTVTSTLTTISINSLTNAETLDVAGTLFTAAAFSVAAASQNSAGATFRLRRVTFGGAGTLTNLGVLETQGVTRLDAGFVNQQGATLRAVASNLFGPTSANGLTFASGFTNFGRIELTSSGGLFTMALRITNGTLTNASGGVITSLAGTGGGRNLFAPLVNQGQVMVAQNLTLDNANRPFVSDAGTINVSVGRTLAVKSGPTQGLVRFGAGTVLSGTGVVDLGGEQVLELPTDFTLAAGGPTLTFGPAGIVNGRVTVNGPGQFINQGTFRSTSDRFNAVAVNQGTFVAVGPSNEISGGYVSGAGSTLRVLAAAANSTGAATLTFSQGFTNNGRIEMTSSQGNEAATLTVQAGTLTNPTGRVIEIAGGTGARTLAAALTNEGQLNLVRSLTVDNAGRTFTNLTGQVVYSAGTSLTLAGGQSVFGDGATVLVGDAANFLNLTGTHTMGLGAAQFLLRDMGPQLKMIGQVTIDGPGLLINQSPLELTGDVINATLDNQGTVIAWGAGNRINGPYSSTPTGDIRIEGRDECAVPYGPGSCRDAELTFGQSFTNNGRVDLTSSDAAWQAKLSTPAGARLTNNAFINALPGTGGLRVLETEVHNYWQINITAPDLLMSGQGVAQNFNAPGGVIDATQGNLSIFGQVTFENLGTFDIGNSKIIGMYDGMLTNFSGTTLTGGTYKINQGAFYFPNANIVTNLADIQLTGAAAEIIDFVTGNNALANFAVNGRTANDFGRFTLNNMPNFNVAGSFTNDGMLTIDADSAFNITAAGATLTNLMGGTLTNDQSIFDISGTLKFNGANIQTNNTWLILRTATAAVVDENDGDGLANLTANAAGGNLILQGGRELQLPVAPFTNSGLVQLDSGARLLLGAAYVQASGGRLRLDSGEWVGDANATFVNQAGAFVEGIGTVEIRSAAGLENFGTVAPGLPAGTSIGTLTVKGNFTQQAGGTLEIQLRSATEFDVLDVREITTGDNFGEAFFGGDLVVQLLGGFEPAAGDPFRVIVYRARPGATTFANTPAGWDVTYNATDVTIQRQ